MNNTYNGWTNYETWCVSLWLTNDQGGADWLEENAREAMADNLGEKDDATKELAGRLEALHDDAVADQFPSLASGASVFADLMRSALAAVNWYEIAEHAIDDLELWAAGTNLPGYMPDDQPGHYIDHDDACEYAATMMEQHADDDDGAAADAHAAGNVADAERLEARAAELREAAESARSEKGEFSYIVAGRCYFVSRA